MFQCNQHVEMNKFLCSLACTWMSIIDSQFYIIDSLSLDEMLTWWLHGCIVNYDIGIKHGVPHSSRKVKINKNCQHKIVNIFLPIIFCICFGMGYHRHASERP